MRKPKRNCALLLTFGMMRIEMTPQKWAFQISHILNAYHNDSQNRFPVDVEEIARNFSNQKYPDDPISVIKGRNLPNFDGGLFKAPPGKKGWGIFFNDAIQSKGRINFTLAHEFGHYLLHRLDHPDGIQCGEQDFVRWESAYGQIEHQANVFAANLLMPLDDFRGQINPKVKINFEMIEHCKNRYAVSLIATILRWLEYTERRAMIVVSRDGFILWSRSSKSAFKSGLYFKTSNQPPISIPDNSLAARRSPFEPTDDCIQLPTGTWFKNEGCEEAVIESELYDFTISLLHFESTSVSYYQRSTY